MIRHNNAEIVAMRVHTPYRGVPACAVVSFLLATYIVQRVSHLVPVIKDLMPKVTVMQHGRTPRREVDDEIACSRDSIRVRDLEAHHEVYAT